MAESNVRAPKYHIEDDDEGKIVIKIIAPLAKPNEANFLVDNQNFIFVSNPYFLKWV